MNRVSSQYPLNNTKRTDACVAVAETEVRVAVPGAVVAEESSREPGGIGV